MFRLQTLVDAYRLTNLQEATLNALKNNELQFGIVVEEFVDADKVLEAMETEEIQPQISLNALSRVSSFQTL
uniref:Uncharacterized protein n=1 Tax=Tanacetum cinerariifolium TaxID=118510 RepID=A0A699UG31_TANCI|nr:hypothetical protein [Tanacetum cinerariifolium]